MRPLRPAASAALLATMLSLSCAPPARAASFSGLDAFAAAWQKVDDYTCKIVTHETEGQEVQDRTYAYAFMKPDLAKIEIERGPGRGGGAVWHGGDTVSGHQGGILSAIHLTVNLHDPRATSLRGDTMNTASFAYILRYYRANEAHESEAPGPSIDGSPTEEILLDDRAPSQTGGVTRELLFISDKTHLPVVRQRFDGTTLVKSEHFIDVVLDPGLSAGDF